MTRGRGVPSQDTQKQKNKAQNKANQFRHPPVVGDLAALLNFWMPLYISIRGRWRPVAGRLTTTITKVLEIAIEVSFLKNKHHQKKKLLHARAKVDVAKALAHCLWTHKILSNNNYSELNKKLLLISVQLTRWQQWTHFQQQ